MGIPRSDWPFGALLQQARLSQGWSIKEAVRRSVAVNGKGISDGRWRQLENGYQQIGGMEIPTKTTPRTVVVAARAVGLNIDAALAAAGFSAEEYIPGGFDREQPVLLSRLSDDELLAELCRRLRSRRDDPEDVPALPVGSDPAGGEEPGVVGEPEGCGGCQTRSG
jgi:hypothetical protein